jgi:hypothetical protein
MKALIGLAIFLGLFYAFLNGDLAFVFKTLTLGALLSAVVYSRLTAGKGKV